MWKLAALALAGALSAAPADLAFGPLNEFALRLLDNTHAAQRDFGKTNVAISPLSVWSVFALLAEGSAGDTFHELAAALRLPRDLRATQALHGAARSILKKNTRDVILNGQSAIFSECTLKIHPEFCQAALGYNTDMFSVDAADTARLAKDINYYVCVATGGRILNAVKPGFLENLHMIIVDALYFKANWTVPFDPARTKEEVFYNHQGKEIGTVNMMYHKAAHNFGDIPELEAQFLELPYGQDKEFSMLIFLPQDGVTIRTLLGNLASRPDSWTAAVRGSEEAPVECLVPRFKLSSQTDLVPPLRYSGIVSIFDKHKAQLPGVSDTPLFVSKTVQNVEIDVNESGTVAASSTVVGLENRVLGNRFEVNKEFVFLIVEKKTNVILFAGAYELPSAV